MHKAFSPSHLAVDNSGFPKNARQLDTQQTVMRPRPKSIMEGNNELRVDVVSALALLGRMAARTGSKSNKVIKKKRTLSHGFCRILRTGAGQAGPVR